MSKRIFKSQAIHEFNKPLMVKVWSDSVLDNLVIDGVEIYRDKIEVLDDKRFIISFCANQNYKAQLKNKLLNFISIGCDFMPDYFIKKDDVQLVDNVVGDKYDIEISKIKKINYEKNLYHALEFDMKVSWNYVNQYNVKTSDGLVVQTYNIEKLKDAFANDGKNGVNFEYVKFDYLNSVYHMHNNEIYERHFLNFQAAFNGVFNLLLSQLVSFKVSFNEETKGARYLKKNIQKNFTISNRPGLKAWQENKKYVKFDMVLYNGVAYRAKVLSNAQTFEFQNWEELGSYKYYSFADSRSFFETEHGKNCWKILKNSLPYMIDKNLGDCVSFKIANSICPNLNDWFEYEGKKFRIIKFVEHKGSYDFIEIFGREIIAFTDSMLPEILETWNGGPWPEVQLNIINYDKFPESILSGLEIMVPDYAEHDRENIFNFIC